MTMSASLKMKVRTVFTFGFSHHVFAVDQGDTMVYVLCWYGLFWLCFVVYCCVSQCAVLICNFYRISLISIAFSILLLRSGRLCRPLPASSPLVASFAFGSLRLCHFEFQLVLGLFFLVVDNNRYTTVTIINK